MAKIKNLPPGIYNSFMVTTVKHSRNGSMELTLVPVPGSKAEKQFGKNYKQKIKITPDHHLPS